MPDRPSGNVTFLFTDIEGSTRLWDLHPEIMSLALARHDALLRRCIESHNGYVFKTVGDAFCTAFNSAPLAISAALSAQQHIFREEWPQGINAIRVRMALHSGVANERDDDYFGAPVNRVARLLAIGHGGQVLVSRATSLLAEPELPNGVSLRDLGSHGLKDLQQPEPVFQLLHPDLPSEFPTLKSLNNRPTNLPNLLSSFIGREKEMDDVTAMLLPPSPARLITLVGSGGTGKTRLAMHVAADSLDAHSDGVWLVELASLVDPEMAAQAVAAVLNVREDPGKPLLETLVQSLKSKRLLLVLDNCEHLLDGCAKLVDAVVRQCPNVHIIATSREVLGIYGERAYRVPPLALPQARESASPEDLGRYAAIRLFVDRAMLVRHDFELNTQNSGPVVRICRRLDGIPLAIELAAARIRSLPVEELETRLSDRFRLLTRGSRSALPRQQTLRALIDWSYDLLQAAEKTLLIRLSVFAGGWSLAAAEEICKGNAADEWEVMDLLTALVDKSLVVSDENGRRYRLLETLREYAAEKRQAEAGDTAERHAVYYAGLAAEQGAAANTNTAPNFDVLMAETDNLRAALEYLWQSDRIETASAIAVNLREFWSHKGRLREAFSNLGKSANRIQSISQPELRARVLKDAGWFAFLLRDLQASEKYTAESVDIAAQIGATEIQANSLNGLALVAQALGDAERAESLFRRTIDLRRTLDHETRLADVMMNLGFLQSTLGKHDHAQRLFAEARSIYSLHSDEQGMANWLCNQSDLALRQSNWTDAEEFAEQSLSRFRQIDNRLGISYALANLAEAASRLNLHDKSASAVREAIAICAETNHRDLLPTLFVTRCRSLLAQQNYADAAVLLAGAERLRDMLKLPPGVEESQSESSLKAGVQALEGENLFDLILQRFTNLGEDELIEHLAPLC